MPKSTPLYNHNSRTTTARQLNISSNVSGRSSFSYVSSQVPVAQPAAPPNPQHEHSTPNFDMDVDETEDHAAMDQNTIDEDTPDGRSSVEAMPGVHVHVVPAKRYANSVGMFLDLSLVP
jgi:hypothetical protein